MPLNNEFWIGRLPSSGSEFKEPDRRNPYPCPIWMLVACILCLWGLAGSGWAQSPDAEKRNDGVPEMAEIVRLKGALGETRTLFRKALPRDRAEGSDGQMEELAVIVDRLDATDAAYDRLLSTLDKDKAYQREIDQLRERITVPGHSDLGQPPFNLSFLDRLLGELAAVEQQKETGELAVNLSRRNIEELTRRLEQSRKELRGAMDSGAVSLQESSPKAIQNTIEEKQTEKEFQKALLWQEKAHLENLERQKEIAELKSRRYRQQIAWVRERVGFDAEDLDSHLKKILENRNQFQERLQKLRDEQAVLEKKSRRFRPKGLSVKPTDQPSVAGAALKAHEAWKRAIQGEFEQVEDMLRLNRLEESVWKNRYELVRGNVSQEQLASWKASVESQLEGLNRLVSLQQKYQTSLQAEMAALEKQLATPDLDNQIRAHWISQQKALRQQADRRFDYLAAILGNAQLHRHFRDEVFERLDQRSWFQRAQEIGVAFGQVWNLEVMVIDDRPVTISKITVALMIFIIGILLSRYIVRLLVRRLLQLTALKATTASTFQKMMSYSAYLLVLLLALRMVNIPLAAFAFLGGAIAIGLGFGAQNLINNFGSSLFRVGSRGCVLFGTV
ncbi:MAG: mechanosensitive ion channel [Desulfobacterales bacterium]|nr:mechanosensitive ion channel [Desulfobacterales bacterium]